MKARLIPSTYISVPSQAKHIQTRRNAQAGEAIVCGELFMTFPGVFDTNIDTELMSETVRVEKTDRFLEVGCGCGAVSILLARKCAHGIATDINPKAIENTQRNIERFGIINLQVVLGNCFANIDGKYNVLICNPPYGNHPVTDEVERMFWDPENEVKRLFFEGAREHLLPHGRIYFGWADFADIDIDLPFTLAAAHGLEHVKTTKRSRNDTYHFIVLEFRVS